MKKALFLFLLFFMALAFSCKRESTVDTELTGLIQKQTASFYQYGTHVLVVNSSIQYALTSDVVNLDQYVNQNITITGNKISGYPVDGGPEYIDVQGVK